ncbi:hypothetical protein BC629DRAFT_1248206, partial [Irpex lacteus]
DGLSLTKRRKEDNHRREAENLPMIFDPSLTVRDDPSKCFRIFTRQVVSCNDTASRPKTLFIPRRTYEIYAEGTCLLLNTQGATSGAGVWAGRNHPWNAAIK